MGVLQALREKLLARKREIDKDVPNHAYDSALALSMQSAGIQEAIETLDQTRTEWVKRKYTLETPVLRLHRADDDTGPSLRVPTRPPGEAP